MPGLMAYLESARKEFLRYKSLGEAALEQLTDSELYASAGTASNSAAVITRHMAGNMLSRWTNPLEEDGEKPWRHREEEFGDPPPTRAALMAYWASGWSCLFNALTLLEAAPSDTILRIRGEAHSPVEAVNRQLAHYAYHVGQLVLIGKQYRGTEWKYQSIPPGESEAFNQAMLKSGKKP